MSTPSSTSSESRKPTSQIDRLSRAFRRGSAPPPRISVPDWADRYRKLAKEAGSTSGAWHTRTVEIARGAMLAVTEPGVHVLTAMVATQLLKTSLLENTAGYFAHLDPCPMLLVQPKEAAAEQFSKERITPLIKATPVLRELIGTSKTRSAEETLLFKSFPGGFLALAGAGSPDNLARRPIRVVMYDEVDKYPITREGDPVGLGDERLATFVNWLSVRVCSPTVEEESRIEASWLESDQRRASVSCPHCAHRQFLDFKKHVHWDKDAAGKHLTATALVYCEACERSWSDGERIRALQTIRWHQTRPFTCCEQHQMPLDAYETAWRQDGLAEPVEELWDWWEGPRHAVYRARCAACRSWAVPNEHAGFTAGKLYSPWPKDRPSEIARKWIAAQGNEHALQVWWNTQMGWPYRRHVGRRIRADSLAARAELWAAEVPDGVALLTCGADVQDYRVELEVRGWGRNEESWSLVHETIDGEFSEPNTQQLLDAALKRRFTRADGREFTLEATCIDTGGHHTQAVYDFVKARLGRRVWGIKGESARNGQRNPVWPTKRPTTKSKKSYRPVIIGTNAAKDRLFECLGKEHPGPGYIHFPADRDLAYFEQFSAERPVTREAPDKRKYRVWEEIPGRANEAIDMAVYAYAALCGLIHVTNLKLNRRADQVGAAVTPSRLRPKDGAAPGPDDDEPPAPPAPGGSAVTRPKPAAAPPADKPDAKQRMRERAARVADRLSRMK